MIAPDENNAIFQLAINFINESSQHIFLTGKAGTGKTTFLKHIKQHTHKRCLVAAPTGVAAINAGGITLHSLFQLPFEPYIPGVSTQKNRFRFSKSKLDLLRQLELLIIDEVSMLRADTLDAIDNAMRGIRRNFRPFGGVQVLYIGDMFQLPPIAKDDEWEMLKPHYTSTFFFHSKVVELTKPVYLELKKIYRQDDPVFINLLNKVRNNRLEIGDIQELNKRYIPNFAPPKGENYITLSTHNYKADQINQRELAQLASKQYFFRGDVRGDFPDYALPTDTNLGLKEGAQIMFIKNDSTESRRFYNGKIAHISRLFDDKIYIFLDDLNTEILLQKEEWKNIKYTLNKETGEIDEEELGSFSQYPLKLAWAITIHKSQGLTFSRAILDLGASFAPGQAYVALSRCTNLEGIVLHSKVQADCVFTDEHAIAFGHSEKPIEELNNIFKKGRKQFWAERLLLYFEWNAMHVILREFSKLLADKTSEEFEPAKILRLNMGNRVRELEDTATKFRRQLAILTTQEQHDNNMAMIKERCEKAIAFFHKAIVDQLLMPFQEYIQGFTAHKKAKTYFKNILALEEDLVLFLENMQRVRYNNIPLAEHMDLDIPRRKDLFTKASASARTKSKSSAPGAPKNAKVEKGATQKLSLEMFGRGMTIDMIAAERKLAYSTIEGHLSLFVGSGEILVDRLLPAPALEEIMPILLPYKDASNPPFKLIVEQLKGKYSFGQVRMAFAHLCFTQGNS